MGKAMFYHLTRRPMEVTLAMLLGKARNAGWRVLVRGTSEARMTWLDDRLWQGDEADFLPHGLAGGPHDKLQPVLLATGSDSPQGFHCVMSIDGAPVAADEINALDRVCVLFDGNDEAALSVARDQWKTLKTSGVQAEYWSEEGGSWEKKAET